MTAIRASSRHHTTARVPDPYAHLHPDWRPPTGWHAPTGDACTAPTSSGATDALAALPTAFMAAKRPLTTSPARGDYPHNSIAGSGPAPTTPPAVAEPCSPASGSPLRAGEGPGERSTHPNPDDEHEDEDAIFCDPYLPGGRETQLVHTALPLRHRIYALHCQGRSISAIARRLRLDRGTVSRHLHAVEDLLLAEQTEDLARLRLRAVEAQHAILAAAWDALICEELNESDQSNEQPYPARRAQLLATAARAARTAAQLQGLFTPTALQAALQSTLAAAQHDARHDAPVPDPATASADALPPGGVGASGYTLTGSGERSVPPAAICGMPASRPISPTASEAAHGYAPTPASTSMPTSFPPGNCGMLTSAASLPTVYGPGHTPAIHGRDRHTPDRTPAIHGCARAPAPTSPFLTDEDPAERPPALCYNPSQQGIARRERAASGWMAHP